MYRYILKNTAAALLLISSLFGPAAAQSNRTQDGMGALGNLLGALAQAGAKSKAQKGWTQVSEQVRACVNTTLSSKNITVEQLIAAGIAPSDQRVAPLVTSCNQIMSAQLQTNIPCNVINSKGQQVSSTCNQVFAREVNGQVAAISRDDFLRAAGNGEKVQIALLETSMSHSARLQAEQRQADLERQKFLASPEGKRQVAAAAAAEKKRAADEAARAKQAQVTAQAEAAKRAREFPYVAKISCEAGGMEFYIVECLSHDGVDVSIDLNNGGKKSSAKYWNLDQIGDQRGGSLWLNLRSKFSIQACNVNDSFRLVLTIQNSSQKTIIKKGALAGSCVYHSI